MRNAHDVGGMLGFGPVEQGDEEKFHDEWERLAFGLTLASIASGFLHNVDENRYAKERMRPQALSRCSYYELWLAALEMNLVENGVLALEDIVERERELRSGTRAERIEGSEPEGLASAIDGMIAYGGDVASDLPTRPRFAVGDAVLVDPPNNRRHSRVPVYAAHRPARVTTVLPAFPVPGVVAHERSETAAWCYQVRFEAADLWGSGAEAEADGVYLDVWETDLRPLTAQGPVARADDDTKDRA